MTIGELLQSFGISKRVIDGALNATVVDVPLAYVAAGLLVIAACLVAVAIVERLRGPGSR